MAKSMTADEMALRIMLDSTLTPAQRDLALANLAKRVQSVLSPKCPECGGDDVDDNGDTYFGVTYCCLGCGHQWQAGEEG